MLVDCLPPNLILDGNTMVNKLNVRFEIGDVVKLNSVGLCMVIYEVNDSGMAECSWFDRDGSVKKNYFLQEVLTRN